MSKKTLTVLCPVYNEEEVMLLLSEIYNDRLTSSEIELLKIKPLKKQTGEKENTPSYSQVFGEWLCYKAEQDSLLTVITPAMREGSGLVEFSKKYPDRYFVPY